MPLIMTIVHFLFTQHTFNIVSTFFLFIVALPLLTISMYGYILLSIGIIARSFLLYGAVAYGIKKDRAVYALQVVRSKIFKEALANIIIQSSHLERERNSNVNTFRLSPQRRFKYHLYDE